MQPNWGLFLYPPGMVLIGWLGCEKLKHGRIWLQAGAWLSIGAILAAISIPWIQSHSWMNIPYKMNPFRHSMGWEELSKALESVHYDPKSHFLAGDKYQTASLLSFYSPGQKRAYFFNVSNTRKNQFSYWPQMEEKEKGRSGFFVVIENTEKGDLSWYESHYRERLAPYFEKVGYEGAFPLFSASGRPVKYAMLFRTVHYSGEKPSPQYVEY
jgi:hypothetical protein